MRINSYLESKKKKCPSTPSAPSASVENWAQHMRKVPHAHFIYMKIYGH